MLSKINIRLSSRSTFNRVSSRDGKPTKFSRESTCSVSVSKPSVNDCITDSYLPVKGHQVLAAAMVALSVWNANPAFADQGLSQAPTEMASSATPTVYFGNGCFWGRQKDFVDTEKTLGRTSQQISAVVGYAGGAKAGPGGKVCYYYSDPRTVYEKLGHAEAVKVDISSSDPEAARVEFKRFADTYFAEFKKTPFGMQRSDPQDAGPGYRNVVGLPGGVNSPLFSLLKDANVNGMNLREGSGNDSGRQPAEEDLLNVVWVVDSDKLPFFRAEQYHQFHNGLGKVFPKEYTRELKGILASDGRIGPTGCTELPVF